MSTLLKDLYSPSFYNKLAGSLEVSLDQFDKAAFIDGIFTNQFADMELKDRMRHTARVLNSYLPARFSDSVAALKQIIAQLLKDNFRAGSLEFAFLPDYIENYGIDDYPNAVIALEFMTQFITCEFAVRPFLIRYPDEMLKQMLVWSQHPEPTVRRLASEGTRPRLPWAMAVPYLKQTPELVLPILENLKYDSSESVRRSVANSLNDIAKSHPHIVLETAKKWSGQSKETDAIIRHGARTLLKQGNAAILDYYGLTANNISMSAIELESSEIRVGENLSFSFTVQNESAIARTIRLEYAIYYMKANGLLSKKVFKISERSYAALERSTIGRKQSFRPITTRTFYSGLHKLSLIVNGEEKTIIEFRLDV
ncbi:DNA alkylation repair protein [Dyadobacter luteus]|jgi:3-methyladenine DNA glycosylase AlkC|uniref:DNA alkylation repair protein n=1 Tax=Dyadobacter luteus TaxID=2259619 RepID=A0A3D8YF89_9BACT|nr:DNA alkylation repair protein [Dyadobacter luteus]REA63263.1 DNA alkylation repair protein [Dyadobacter luteus]